MELAMVDDCIVPLDQARISAHDRGIYFGDGVYEVLRYCAGRLFALDGHMARLRNSLTQMDMLAKTDLNLITERIKRAVTAAGIDDAAVYFHITRGSALRSHDYSDDWTPNFLLTVRSFHRRDGAARAITHPDWRWHRCDIKSLNFVANVMAQHTAHKKGAYEALLVDGNNLVTEATSSSVLIIKDKLMQTAPLTANILPGITRALLLEWAGSVGLATAEESFTVSQASNADELLITGTGSEVIAITHLDDKPIADGQPGAYTKIFRNLLYQAMYT